MRGINRVIIIGRLGNDPEAKYLPSGGAVTNISVATSESWKDKNTGQQQEKTEWHRIVFFNKLAEIAAEYLRKGSKVYIEGSLRTRKWQGQDGSDRYTTEIVASEMQMLDSKGDSAPQNQGFAPQPQQAPQQPQYNPQSAQAQNVAGQGFTPQQPAPQGAPQQFDNNPPF